MARLGDRVKETTTTTGTGTVTLLGAAAQFQAFAAKFADGAQAYYSIVGQSGTEWEVGLGTVGAAGTTLARSTVLDSSNAGALVNFSAGTKDVFCTAPAVIFNTSQYIYQGAFVDPNGNLTPNNPTSPAIYFPNGGGTTWQWDVPSQLWV